MDCIKTQFVALVKVNGLYSVTQMLQDERVMSSQSFCDRYTINWMYGIDLAKDNVISLSSLVSKYSLKRVNTAVGQRDIVSLDMVIDWMTFLVTYNQVLPNISFRIYFVLIQLWYDHLPGNQQGGTSIVCPHQDLFVERQGQSLLALESSLQISAIDESKCTLSIVITGE